MRTRNRMTNLAFFACLLSILITVGAPAQSGRKIPKQPKNTAPEPPPAKEPAEEKTAPQPDTKPAIPVIVASDVQYISSSDIVNRIVAEGVLNRLGEFRSVKAQPGGDRINRKEASDLAKKSTDTYVLWFELQLDAVDAQRSTSRMDQARNLYVNFVVFSPGGKIKTSGHVYQRSRVPYTGGLPTPTVGTAEYSLRWAGRETADRLLDTLGLSTPLQIPR